MGNTDLGILSETISQLILQQGYYGDAINCNDDKTNFLMSANYQSHGTYITSFPHTQQSRFHKPTHALITPLPTSKAKIVPSSFEPQLFEVAAKTVPSQFRFQSKIDPHPVAHHLTQPFLYVEKVHAKQPLDAKIAKMGKMQPFKTSKKITSTKNSALPQLPQGFSSLYEYQQVKRRQAVSIFKKLHSLGIADLKETFVIWNGKGKKTTLDLNVKEKQFVDFINEVAPNAYSEKQLKQFFNLYGKIEGKIKVLSIKAFSYNYNKFIKSQEEPSNLMSEKAIKQRYLVLRNYCFNFDEIYGQLKLSMEKIKKYQQSLRSHFKQIFQSYEDPHKDQIENLKIQLQKPLIKYDKFKKTQIEKKIERLTKQDNRSREEMNNSYEQFIKQYQLAILMNHDLFFTKHTVITLLLPIVKKHPFVNRNYVSDAIAEQQNLQQAYLECLSDFMVEIDYDKKMLHEDCFTLDDLVQLVKMRDKTNLKKYSAQYAIGAIKELIKEIKKQYLLKNDLFIQDIEAFPADKEISLQLIHMCFKMECSKVLLKNKVWNELIQYLPLIPNNSPKLHRQKIQANLCLEFLNRYFQRIDQKINLQMKKAKYVSLLCESVEIDKFKSYSKIIEKVIEKVKTGQLQYEEQEMDKVEPLNKKDERKVGFADVVQRAFIKHEQPQQFQSIIQQEQQQAVNQLLKAIFDKSDSNKKIKQQQSKTKQIKQQQLINFFAGKTLDKSLIVDDSLNTNVFDIRFYQKMQKQQQIQKSSQVRLGTSVLLSMIPRLDQIKSTDPLKISKLLVQSKTVHSIDKNVKRQRLQNSVREGIDRNYYKDKIKLQNKPTVYDSDGKSKYSVLLPVGYYESFLASQNAPDSQKWYLHPHHIETLTQNQLSKKDNLLGTEYESKLSALPQNKRPDEYVIEENVNRKQQLIGSLQSRIAALKQQMGAAMRGNKNGGAVVPVSALNNYLHKATDHKQDKDLELGTYESILYDLRREERGLLNVRRGEEEQKCGMAGEKWWERKDKGFNNQLRKDRVLVADSLKQQHKHQIYVNKLGNKQVY